MQLNQQDIQFIYRPHLRQGKLERIFTLAVEVGQAMRDAGFDVDAITGVRLAITSSWERSETFRERISKSPRMED